MNTKIKLYDIVKAKTDLKLVKKGTRGTILIIYPGAKNYEVEFVDEQGNTLNVLSVFEDDLELTDSKNMGNKK